MKFNKDVESLFLDTKFTVTAIVANVKLFIMTDNKTKDLVNFENPEDVDNLYDIALEVTEFNLLQFKCMDALLDYYNEEFKSIRDEKSKTNGLLIKQS